MDRNRKKNCQIINDMHNSCGSPKKLVVKNRYEQHSQNGHILHTRDVHEYRATNTYSKKKNGKPTRVPENPENSSTTGKLGKCGIPSDPNFVRILREKNLVGYFVLVG